MSILTDFDISMRSGMIEPFHGYSDQETENPKPRISRGLTSAGYDATLGNHFKIFHNMLNILVDPCNPNELGFTNVVDTKCIIPPNGYILGTSEEYFKIPDDIFVVCIGKSTLARCGIIANVTPLEPGWEGNITIELSNATPCPAVVYAGCGIIQLVFHKLEKRPIKTYADKNGKYQKQVGLTLAR